VAYTVAATATYLARNPKFYGNKHARQNPSHPTRAFLPPKQKNITGKRRYHISWKKKISFSSRE
jgi:hypothetical protein